MARPTVSSFSAVRVVELVNVRVERPRSTPIWSQDWARCETRAFVVSTALIVAVLEATSSTEISPCWLDLIPLINSIIIKEIVTVEGVPCLAAVIVVELVSSRRARHLVALVEFDLYPRLKRRDLVVSTGLIVAVLEREPGGIVIVPD